MENIRIIKFQPKYAQGVSYVIVEAFERNDKNQFSKEAVKDFFEWFNSGGFEKELFDSEVNYIALKDDKVIAFIYGKRNKIFNFFVLTKYQGKKIGSDLLKKYESETNGFLKVDALLNSVPFYLKKGYKKSTGIKKMSRGIFFQPMKKVLH